jgi:DnaK suppressor protein
MGEQRLRGPENRVPGREMTLSEDTRKRFCKLLLDMREESLQRLRGKYQSIHERDSAGDAGDFASGTMVADSAARDAERLWKTIMSIDEALAAIDSGDYGVCEECGDLINEKRLLLMPFTLMCVKCQSELERRTRMGGQSGPDSGLDGFPYSDGRGEAGMDSDIGTQ